MSGTRESNLFEIILNDAFGPRLDNQAQEPDARQGDTDAEPECQRILILAENISSTPGEKVAEHCAGADRASHEADDVGDDEHRKDDGEKKQKSGKK